MHDHILFIPSSADGHLGFFPLLAIVGCVLLKNIVWTFFHVSFYRAIFFFLMAA